MDVKKVLAEPAADFNGPNGPNGHGKIKPPPPPNMNKKQSWDSPQQPTQTGASEQLGAPGQTTRSSSGSRGAKKKGTPGKGTPGKKGVKAIKSPLGVVQKLEGMCDEGSSEAHELLMAWSSKIVQHGRWG